MTDELGRPALAAEDRASITQAFEGVTGRGALLVIVGPDKVVRGHVAARLGDHWKVAAGAGFVWEGKRKTSGWLGIERVW